MNKENLFLASYELAFLGKTQTPLSPEEQVMLKQILLTKENFTYTELENLEAETVEIIYEVIRGYNSGEEFKNKQETNKAKSK